jgi:prophage maintenance system killer protein
MRPFLLNLPEIDSSLRAVQAEFGRINATLYAQRDVMSDEVRVNMMAGYRRVDDALASGIDLFELGNSKRLLELNILVLCGTDPDRRKDFARHIASTEQRFYEQEGGGIGTLMEWLQRNNGDDVFRRAAGVYIHILSRPELYIEGNHRTGALIMSYMLAREGKPPFVLSVDNAKAYFDPSTLMQATRRQSLRMLIRLPKLRDRFASMLKDTADSSYLIPLT